MNLLSYNETNNYLLTHSSSRRQTKVGLCNSLRLSRHPTLADPVQLIILIGIYPPPQLTHVLFSHKMHPRALKTDYLSRLHCHNHTTEITYTD
jgi:hypothetical protein